MIELTTAFSIAATILVAVVGWFARAHTSQIAALVAENKDQGKNTHALDVRLVAAEQKLHDTGNIVEVFRVELSDIREHMARREDLDKLNDQLGQRISDALRQSGPRRGPPRK